MSNEDCCGEAKSCCCSASACCSEELITTYDKADKWVMGEIVALKGNIPIVSTQFTPKDVPQAKVHSVQTSLSVVYQKHFFPKS